MPRRRRVPTEPVGEFPGDFPKRLERFKAASGMSWRAIARRLGTQPRTVRRWRSGAQPQSDHLFRLFALAYEVPCGSAILVCGACAAPGAEGDGVDRDGAPTQGNSSRLR